MKKLLFSLLMLISLASYSQEKPKDTSLSVKEVYEDAKTGFKDAFNGLRTTAERLEGPAKHVYTVYVYQHRAYGIANILLILVLLIISLGMLFFTKNWKNADFDGWNRAATISLFGAGLFVVAVGFSVAFFTGNDCGLMQMLNPEYYAIQDIIKAFK